MSYLDQVPLRELDLANIARETQSYIDNVLISPSERLKLEKGIIDLFSINRAVTRRALKVIASQVQNITDTDDNFYQNERDS